MSKLKTKMVRTSISMPAEEHAKAKKLAVFMSMKKGEPVSVTELYRHLLNDEYKKVEKDDRFNEIRTAM